RPTPATSATARSISISTRNTASRNRATSSRRSSRWRSTSPGSERYYIVAAGLCGLLVVEWILETHLGTTANGAHFAAQDGRMAEAVVRTAYRFAAPFAVNNLNPLQGIGSQLLPLNVWANPVHWPLAWLQGKLATDIAGMVALSLIAVACYAMVRCFGLPRLPSVLAAQLCVAWFGPVGPLLSFTPSFVLLPGLAAVYAPSLLALGLLARIEPGRVGNFLLLAAGIAALIFYSLYCDPLWSVVCAISWSVPFAIVAVSPLRI